VKFEELLHGVKEVKLEEMREHETDYMEVVVSRENLEEVEVLLTSYFGAPIKPAGERASKEASKRAKAYGGIMPNQTMYFQEITQKVEMALLWPWSGGGSITIKLIQE